MGAIAVQANKTKKQLSKEMMTHALLHEAIRNDFEISDASLPAKQRLNIQYGKGAEGSHSLECRREKTKIPLPLEDGWYLPENEFAIPIASQVIATILDFFTSCVVRIGNLTVLLGVAATGRWRRWRYVVAFKTVPSFGGGVGGGEAARLDAVQGAHGPEAHSAAPLVAVAAKTGGH